MKRTATFIAALCMCSFLWINAQKNWMEGWDGGDKTGAGSEPDKFGWLCDNPDFDGWAETDFVTPGTVRYSTTLASNCAIFDSVEDGEDFPKYYDNNRLLIIRWDGNFVNYWAYKLTSLSAGKTYKFSWVYAWYDNADECILRVGVNKNQASNVTDNTEWEAGKDVNDDIYYQYFFEIMDDLIGPTDRFPYKQKQTVHPSEFEFTVPENGDYYLTITCSDVIKENLNEAGSPKGPMAMIGGFSVTEVDESSVNFIPAENITIRVENNRIFVDGAENFTVTSMTGMQMNSDAELNTGIYIVSVNGKAYKTIVK